MSEPNTSVLAAHKPWKVYRDHPESKDIAYIRLDGSKFCHDEIAVVYSSDDTNARLIAAAPQMLAALELCVAYMLSDDPYPTEEEGRQAAFEAAQKAISHATAKLVCLRAEPIKGEE